MTSRYVMLTPVPTNQKPPMTITSNQLTAYMARSPVFAAALARMVSNAAKLATDTDRNFYLQASVLHDAITLGTMVELDATMSAEKAA
jgi:hypothetical protein